ncbi:hypothetical protein [Streptomyces sp. NPDC003247]
MARTDWTSRSQAGAHTAVRRRSRPSTMRAPTFSASYTLRAPTARP